MSRTTSCYTRSLPALIATGCAVGSACWGWYKHRQAAQLRHQVEQHQYDPSSGAFRREPFNRHAQELLRTKPTTLLFIDLDRFKELNVSRGHAVGDELIVAVVNRLLRELPHAVVGRFGGDEFVAAVPNAPTGAERDAWLSHLFAVLTAEVAGRDVSDGHALHPWMSIGAAPADQGENLSRVEKKADLAMYTAKSQGGGTRVYHPSMGAPVVTSEAPRERTRERGPECAMA